MAALALAGCNPFYSVEQSDVERGYRWLRRMDFVRAEETFDRVLVKHPSSGLATLGLADTLAERGRHAQAIERYGQALSLLSAEGLASATPHTGPEQVIGERFFSYQNQGLSFPYGLTAYIHFRRGLAYERAVRWEDPAPAAYRTLAIAEFVAAARAAPGWDEPDAHQRCLMQVDMSQCP